MEIPITYSPKDFEDDIYKDWEAQELFNPDKIKPRRKEHFSIVLPPPNVTGTLHLGHASMLAIEDLFVRYKRMQGFDTAWIPGTDHAAIATQNVVEKKLWKEEGKTRHDLGRERFLERVEAYVEDSKNIIHNQIRKMGASLDWSREAYTLDETRARAVRKVFKMMYDDGLIYRGYRIVNWCPRCKTTLADDEVDYKEQSAKLYTFKYDKNFPFAIATTRPETKLGDTAVAVNPNDERYQKYIGQTFDVNFCGVDLKIKIIADDAVESEFGTGALGVTPAHSAVDFDMAQKNNLEIIKVIDEDAKMTDKAGKFAGMSVEEAREKISAELEKNGLLEKTEELINNLSVCYRCKSAIEPLTSDQWFINVNKKFKVRGSEMKKSAGKEASLKELSLSVVKDKNINIIPERFEKTYFHWMENLRDWCISRQLWFGHQIPVWYCDDCDEHVVTELSATELFVMRHGEAKNNVLDQLNSDIENQINGLTEKGKEQVEAVFEKLKNEKIGAIYCSDFRRTKETAAIINEKLNLPIIEDPRLREVGVGEFEGKHDAELAAFRQNNFAQWQNDNPHGIESFESLKTRVFACLEEIAEKFPGQKVLIITHGDVCRIVQGFRKNIADEKLFKMDYPLTGEYLHLKFAPIKCKCGSQNLKQDEDTLDTWFSAGLWTFSTLLEKDFETFDKKENPLLKRFHPTTVLETGYDILFFWVARMILMTTYATGEVPFENVYLHGLIRDKEGDKMSKSKPETAIDPLDAGRKYGFDAVRLSLLIGNTAGNDIRLYDEKIEGYRNFVNKLWNISRFILMEQGGRDKQASEISELSKTLADRWIISRFNKLIREVTKLLDEYNFSSAGELLREFTWNDFADWYLEISKVEQNKEEMLKYIFKNLLKLWHPFVPFVTETIWKQMNPKEKSLMISEWPEFAEKAIDENSEKEFESVKELIIKIRNVRSENKVQPAKKIRISIISDNENLIKEQRENITALSRAEVLTFTRQEQEKFIKDFVPMGEIYFYMTDLIDPEKEKERIEKEKNNLENYISGMEKKLSNDEFVNNAPRPVVEGERQKLAEAREKLEKILEQLGALK